MLTEITKQVKKVSIAIKKCLVNGFESTIPSSSLGVFDVIVDRDGYTLIDNLRQLKNRLIISDNTKFNNDIIYNSPISILTNIYYLFSKRMFDNSGKYSNNKNRMLLSS